MALKAWERQPKESHQAFEAFKEYRDLGVERSHAKVAQKVGKNKGLIDRWGRVWKWQERVEAFDRYMDEESVKEEVRSRREMHRRHAAIAVAIQGKIIERLQNLDHSTLKPFEIARLLEVAAKTLERPAREDLSRPMPPQETSAAHEQREQDDQFLHDPEARRLAMDLFDRLAGREAVGPMESRGAGEIPQQGALEAGAASEPAQSQPA